MSSTATLVAPEATSRRPRLGVAAAVVVAATAGQALSNLVFHGIAGHHAGPAEYAAVATLLNVILMLTVPLGALQAAVTTAAAEAPGAATSQLIRRCLAGSIAVALVVCAAAPAIGAFLHVPAGDVLLLAPYVVVATLLAVARGVAFADGRTFDVSATVLGAAVMRVGLGLALVPVFGLHGALVATLVAEAAGLGVLALRRSPARTADMLRVPGRAMSRSAVVVTGLWCFTGIDTLLARHHLDAVTGASYVAAGTLARCTLAVPAALVMASLDRFTGDIGAARQALRRVALMILALGIASTLGLVVAGGILQQLLFGDLVAPASLVVLLGAVAGLSGLVTLLTYFHIARHRSSALFVWVAAAIEVTLIEFHHGSPTQVLTGSAVSMLFGIGVLTVSLPRPTAVAAADVVPHALPDPTALDRPADPAVELSVVVPFYNPGPSVVTTIESIVSLMRAAGVGFEVVAVCDGATDDSAELVAAIPHREVRLIEHPANRGKGAAVRTGFDASTGRYIAFIDADGDIDPVHLLGYLARIREGGDAVIADKTHADSVSASSASRKLVSFGFRTMVGTLFRLGTADTQTGCKVFRREVIADVAPYLQEERFALDLELLVVARRRGHRDLRPAPVELGERLAGSTVTVKAILRTVKDVWVIWSRTRFTSAYPAVRAARPARTVFTVPTPVTTVTSAGDLAWDRAAA